MQYTDQPDQCQPNTFLQKGLPIPQREQRHAATVQHRVRAAKQAAPRLLQ